MNRITGPDREWLVFTVLDRPTDFPDRVVVRAALINRPDPDGNPEMLATAWTFDTVREARDMIREIKPEAMCLPRAEDDFLSVVEVWF